MMRCAKTMQLVSLAGGKLLTAIALLLCICLLLPSVQATGHIVWQKHLGGSKSDVAYSITHTDRGYAVAGRAGALTADDGDVKDNRGYRDYWIVNLSSSGNLIWQRRLGGSKDEHAQEVQQTTDGGYVVAGYSYSNDAHVKGNHGGFDYWVVKLNQSGLIEWQKCLGGSKWEFAHSIQQTTDGGYIVAGNTDSNDGDVSGHHGDYDLWVVKLNPLGKLLWQRCMGGES